MRILVNGVSARLGGGRTVLRSHVGALAASPEPNELIVLTADGALLSDLGETVRVLSWPRLPTALRVPLEQLAVPILALRYRAQAVYCIGNVGLLLPIRPVIQLLQSAHHFSSLAPPERGVLYSRSRRLRYRLEARLARVTARRSQAVCAVSSTLSTAVRSEWPEVADRVRVLSNSLPHDPPPRDPGLRLPPFCLFVANDYPHKHWDDVIDLFQRRTDLPALLVVGRPDSHRDDEVCELDTLELELSVQRSALLGALADRGLLVWLYENAAAVLVHSTCETFGVTLLEGLAHNGRVAAADLPAHREVAGDRTVEFYDPVDDEGMAKALIGAMKAATPDRRIEAAADEEDLCTSLSVVFRQATADGVSASVHVATGD